MSTKKNKTKCARCIENQKNQQQKSEEGVKGSKFHIKCTKDATLKKPQEPEGDEDNTYCHTESSKFHEKCIEREFPKKKPPLPPEPEPESPKRSSLLDLVTTKRDCTCAVVARAVRSHLHMNLGLEEKRDAINACKDEDVTEEIPLPPDEVEKKSKSILGLFK